MQPTAQQAAEKVIAPLAGPQDIATTRVTISNM
jgi:hypothetical protein